MNKCVAHRGWSGRAPENTLIAFKLALLEPQIDAIELDVHLSKDGVPVVIHDHSLERTTNGNGAVIDHTVEELQALDAGKWFSQPFEREGIPLLEEVLYLAKGRKHLLIELKQLGNLYNGLEEKVVRMIHSIDMQDQVTIISFDHESLRKIKELDHKMEVGLLFFGCPTKIVEQMDHIGANHLSIHHHFITKELVDSLKHHPIQIGAWTVNDSKAILRIKNISKDIMITTNHPELLMMDKTEQLSSPSI
ncbi:glycerophosphodiester phosphodiesterase [Niallia sp. 03133]|uniref:glycerophosphodiester phosphodiesterase n=1 Tax=Niallia sp. 03133 TaxID=3458060 RepID=UPI00404453D6